MPCISTRKGTSSDDSSAHAFFRFPTHPKIHPELPYFPQMPHFRRDPYYGSDAMSSSCGQGCQKYCIAPQNKYNVLWRNTIQYSNTSNTYTIYKIIYSNI